MTRSRITLATCGALLAAVVTALPLASPADAQKQLYYGVSTQGNAPLGAQDFNMMRRARVGTLRIPVAWSAVQPRLGASYRFGHIDRVVGEAAKRGLRAFPTIHAETTPEGVRKPPTRKVDRQAFRALTRALAKRYGRGGDFWQGFRGPARPVSMWQLWNEPNGIQRWSAGRVRPRPRAYAGLLRFGAQGVRSQDRRAQIVTAGLVGKPRGRGSMTAWRFLNQLYRVKGARRAFDIVALHPYSRNVRELRQQMQRVRRVMRKRNDRGTGIRVTELGWGSARRGHRLNVGPKRQARLLRQSFGVLSNHRNRRNGWNTKGIDWYSWEDGGHCGFCPTSGLVQGSSGDRQPKPSYRVYRKMARR
jgi:hypothetical protein